ncbi:fused acetyl/propionyl-CoA carboxylase subuit alpha/methylmalonyl-CoA decarboxylase subunit alpha [Mycolicibacterium chitae]|uniref:Acetyl-/propionyl-coenzyme A carboxylase alpha chain AccA1 n=3 Tax=Mycolicibacterium chitae TaxID=1792 RepID=A0A448IDP3_MYCCI|nr:carboxyl transferase domain-containing protein [Mycolicibacterium chitae]BBZ01741.1 fused acetyl/propionyl-CoA carboxylase subuit alpha/methylmalonyl-CoA decarboxylase subunit alpha [Mycolicibacterium chitae]VEG50576.1 acetyl-/propionyl-coenzyme A carboxylase alpha chain AccA1 [Mycolicibacterium chitae]
MTGEPSASLNRVAIVNRGESAMRFLNAAREYGIERGTPLETVALYTEADAASWFVRAADHAINLGPTMVTDPETGARRHTYLDTGIVESALVLSGADAVWPGWGFVAENPDFVRMCDRLGVQFIGPTAASMDMLGDKIAAKRIAESVDVPVVPWSGGPVDTVEEAVEHAKRIGFPVVLKAAAGGGGRGIRLVRNEIELPAAFKSARAEADSAFGDATLFVEAQITGGRHLEVQVAADNSGNVWTLGLRDCSVQRRRQKVLEESAPVDIDDALQQAIREAARRMCQAVDYTNVGTVEFLFQPSTGSFYFLEVNTRLQVEHTVTEAVTGVDLVKLQLDIAQGAQLAPDSPEVRGHAIEVRLNAEDPKRGFTPAPGRVVELRVPQGPWIRTDAGVAEGDTIASEFDSMIAKVIAWGRDRPEALARLRRALGRSQAVIEGGTTNRRFLMALLDNPEIQQGNVDTTWLDRALDEGILLDSPDAPLAMVCAAVEAYRTDHADALDQFAGSAVHGRLHPLSDETAAIDLEYEGERRSFRVQQRSPNNFDVEIDGLRIAARVEELGQFERRISVAGRELSLVVVPSGPLITVELDHSVYRIVRGHGGLIRAESQCVIAKVAVEVGDEVNPGDVLLITEAMKMESPLMAPFGGRVSEIVAGAGTLVGAGDPIIRIEAVDDEGPADTTQMSFAALAHNPAQLNQHDEDRDVLTRLVLGQDLSGSAVGDALTRVGELSFTAGLHVLGIVADRMALFAGDPELDNGAGRRPMRTDLLLVALRAPDRITEVAPADFVARLRQMLAHYDVTEISQSTELTDALFNIWRAESRLGRIARMSAGVLETWLESDDHDPNRSAELVDVLDRLIDASEAAYPTVTDLARAVRHRLVEAPAIEALRAADEKVAEGLLADAGAGAREAAFAGLRRLPEPIDHYLAAQTADPARAAVALRALVRRTHRHRTLDDFEVLTTPEPIVGVRTGRRDGIGRMEMLAFAGPSARLADLVAGAAEYLTAGHTEALEIEIILRDNETRTDVAAAVEAALPALPPGCPEVNVVVTWWQGSRDDERGSRRHCVFAGADSRFTRVDGTAGIHPATADRVELWRFNQFDISAVDAPDGIHLIKAVAKENPQDERLLAVLEVFDLDGDAHVTNQLAQAAIAIRRARALLPDPSVSLSNRIIFYVEPRWTLTDAQLQSLIVDLLPLTRGLGLEKVIGRVRVGDAGSGDLVDEVIHVTTPPTVGVMVGRTKPSPTPLRPMSEYRRRVVAMQRRGLVYPYEIVELLVGTGATHTELPTGEFTEYDFVGEQFEVVDRPRGNNTARVVTGVIDSHAASGATFRRVLILNDPSRDLGSLAEPECRRIVAALDLATELGVPVEWYAVSSGARIAMDSGTENLDWTAAVLRRIIEFTQGGGEINVMVVGVNVGAQSYFDAESTMLMHTSGVLIMVGNSAMVLTGKQALEFSGGVAAEDNAGIGGYARIAGPNGQAQFWVADVESGCALLFAHYESSQSKGARFDTADPADRDISGFPHRNEAGGTSFACVGEIFSAQHNPDRKRPFDIRSVMSAVMDQDAPVLERWPGWEDAQNVVAWDTRLGGFAVSLIGIESRNLRRPLPRPADGPDTWTSGTLFPQSSKKLARVINGASGKRPLVILANLSGFDGSPESMAKLQLEYGAEIGRAIVNFRGPIVFSVISRYHGGAYVVFSKSLNANMEVSAVTGSRASVIGGAPAAAVVFTREVRERVRRHPEVVELERQIAAESADEQPMLQHRLHQLTAQVTTEIQAIVAREFDDIHTVERALQVGSIDHIVAPPDLRPYLISAVQRGLERSTSETVLRKGN